MKAILNVATAVVLTSIFTNANAQKLEPTTTPMMKTKYGHVYVNTQLNNVKEQPMVLDTAATAGVIPNSVLAQLSIPDNNITKEDVHGAGGIVSLSKVQLATTQVANIKVDDLPYVIQDMKVLKLDSGKVPGILGVGFLSKQCTILDFENELVTFYKNTCPKQASKNLNAANIWLEDDLIKLSIKLNGVVTDAILDTGSPVNIINSHLLDKLATEKLDKDKLEGLHSKGITHQKLGEVSYSIGEKVINSNNTIASDMPVFKKLGYENKPVFLLGLADFTKNKLVIDYQANKIYF